MKRISLSTVLAVAITVLWCTAAFGQTVLPNDTLYIGRVTGTPGQHIMVPLYIRTTDYYQGWTLPLKFGTGSSPLTCDSVSFNGTVMESWAWKSKFVNNNQWDNVQTCGATGIYVWAGDSMLPGYYLALKLFFGIAGTATPQAVVIDTTTCSFAQGGQQNNFIVVVHTQSWRTIVVPGSVTIGNIGVAETNLNNQNAQTAIYPTVVKRGKSVQIKINGAGSAQGTIGLYDVNGRMVDNMHLGTLVVGENSFSYSTDRLANGVYLLAIKNGEQTVRAKLIVE